MHANEQLITTFYTAFQDKDHAVMAACYDPSVHFSDPVFTELHGLEAKAMWHMLCEQGTDLVLEFSNVAADDSTGSAHWEPTYTLESTGRVIHNTIDATFEFRDGRIIRHVDDFSLWHWARMAVGWPGRLTGWSGAAQSKIRDIAEGSLERFIESHPEYQTDQ